MRGAEEIKTFFNYVVKKKNHNVNLNFPLSVASTTKMANHLNYNTGKHINDIAKLDSGATNHYLKPNHIKLLTHIETPKSQHEINLPNNAIIKATKQGQLHLHPNLPSTANTALILPQLSNESLLSIGQLCDNNCSVLFEKDECIISHNNKQIIRGIRNKIDGLWDINLQKTTNKFLNNHNTQSINFKVSGDKTKTELAQYIHACMFSPCIKTLEQAIKKGNLLSWPVENLNFSKLLKTSLATEKGHLD